MHNSAMPNTNNEMSFYDSDFEIQSRRGWCEECGGEIDEYGDEIDADKTPHEVVLIVNENDGDDYRQLSFDFGEEDIRNKQTTYKNPTGNFYLFLSLLLISTYAVAAALLESRHLALGDL